MLRAPVLMTLLILTWSQHAQSSCVNDVVNPNLESACSELPRFKNQNVFDEHHPSLLPSLPPLSLPH